MSVSEIPIHDTYSSVDILVSDFVARYRNGDLTNTRTVSGSLRYMAPERFAGVSGEAGDVYGIGITLYELLAGRPAFAATLVPTIAFFVTSAASRPLPANISIANGQSDVDSIDPQFTDHPLVVRARDAIEELADKQ